MSIARTTEITASSSKSFDDALKSGIKRAAKTLQNITGAWIKDQEVVIAGVGTRIEMLYEGQVRAVGTVDEIQHSTDPLVRQFIEGRATLEGSAPLIGVASGDTAQTS